LSHIVKKITQVQNKTDNKKNKKASIRWQDSAPPISGYWQTS